MRVSIFVAFFLFVPFWACKGEELPNITDIKPEYKDAIQLNYDYNSILDYEQYEQCIERTGFSCTKTEPAVKYLYITNQPVVFSDNEDYFAITKNTRTYEIDGVKKIKIYGSDAFIEEGGVWYETGIGYAQKAVWDSVVADTLVKAKFDDFNPFKIYRVNAQTYYAEAGDDSIMSSGDSVWATEKAKTTGTLRNSDRLYAMAVLYEAKYYIERAYINFDTSGLADDANIASASVFLDALSGNALGAEVTIYDSTASDPVVANDFDNTTLTQLSDTLKDTTDCNSDNTYMEFPLNAAGLAEINLTGITPIGFMNYTYDAQNSAPTNYDTCVIYNSDYTGTTRDPYLEVVLEEEPPAGTSTPIVYNVACEPENINDIGFVTACSYTSSTTGITYTNYNIPFFVWVVFWAVMALVFTSLLHEIIYIFRS